MSTSATPLVPTVADPSVTVNIVQAPGVVITQSAGNTTVIEATTTDTYTMALRTKPGADVTITLSPGSGLALSATTLTFTTANWNVPQTVTVSAPDDGTFTGPRTGSIIHAATSSDPIYNGIAVAGITVNTHDTTTRDVAV